MVYRETSYAITFAKAMVIEKGYGGKENALLWHKGLKENNTTQDDLSIVALGIIIVST